MIHRFTLGRRSSPLLAGLLVAVLTGASLCCVSREERLQGLKELPLPRIATLSPSMTVVATGFQVQPSADSALVVTGSNFMNASRVCVDGKTTVTTFGSGTLLTALVPPELYSQAGDLEVTVENGDGQRSNAVIFRVLPASGPAPQVRRVRPDSCVVGQGFNIQPGGESALAVDGANFVPGTAIYFDASPLATTFGDPGTLTAIVPPSLLTVPRAAKIYVRNPDGKASEPLGFAVERRR